jgi:hypothetical protein
MLAAVRSTADEIVLAVDAASPAAESPALSAVADRIFRIEYVQPFERYLAWLHSLCRCEWVLRLDGDELPSASLVEALPTFVADRSVLQYRVPRRWLYHDARHWLDQVPWQPDHQIRLVRNIPATLRFSGRLHSSAEALLPARYLLEPIYHVTLLVATQKERERRVNAYDQSDEAPQVDNALFYLPERERLKNLTVANTPAADVELIESMLGARPGARDDRLPAPTVDVNLEDVNRHWALREFDAGGYEVELLCLEPDLVFVAGREQEVRVLVRNNGTESLPWGGGPPNIWASYHWLTPTGDVVVPDGHRTPLPAPVAPGGDGIVPVQVAAPAEPGEYILEFDLVHEGVRWFECGARVPAMVTGGIAAGPDRPREQVSARRVTASG